MVRLPGVRALQRSARWLRSRFVGGALILGYHRIASGDWDPFSLSVAPGHFAEHLEVIRRHAHPLPLPQLVRGLERGRLPSASVALTFDDGYADNLTRAKPLLERYGVPATMFVTTAHLGSEFWWDRLYWRFTAASCARLFGEHFGATDVTVTSHGNVLERPRL